MTKVNDAVVIADDPDVIVLPCMAKRHELAHGAWRERIAPCTESKQTENARAKTQEKCSDHLPDHEPGKEW